MDFSKHKFRCSSLGALMSDSKDGGITAIQLDKIKELQAKAQVKDLTANQTDELLRLIAKRDNPMAQLGDTCLNKLVEIYIFARFKRRKDIESKYLDKGLQTEEESISLYSEVKQIPYFKNEIRLENEFISGEPDTHEGPSVRNATNIIDFKSSWDVFTFFATKTKKTIDSVYDYQVNGYCDLSGADKGTLAYCLNNTPEHLIEREINNLRYKLGIIDPDAHPEFLAAAEEIRHNMTFDDIPKPERVLEYTVRRDFEKIKRVYHRLRLCRIWLNEFAYKLSKTSLINEHEPASIG